MGIWPDGGWLSHPQGAKGLACPRGWLKPPPNGVWGWFRPPPWLHGVVSKGWPKQPPSDTGGGLEPTRWASHRSIKAANYLIVC
jgi:hypothetical protein